MRRRCKTPQESFAARTERVGECLLWTGSGGRYGKISIGGGREMLVHRWVWEQQNGPIPPGMEVDHICHVTLCAEITHLRLTTRKQNLEHTTGHRNSTSQYRGVSWDKRRRKWMAKVGHNHKTLHLGEFDTEEDAAEAARLKRLELFTHNDHDRITPVS